MPSVPKPITLPQTAFDKLQMTARQARIGANQAHILILPQGKRRNLHRKVRHAGDGRSQRTLQFLGDLLFRRIQGIGGKKRVERLNCDVPVLLV